MNAKRSEKVAKHKRATVRRLVDIRAAEIDQQVRAVLAKSKAKA